MFLFRQLSFLFYVLGRRLLALWVKSKVLPENIQALGINPDKPVCYVLETRSASNLMLLDLKCRELGLPSPRRVLGSEELKGWRSVYSLIPRRGALAKGRRLRDDTGKLKAVLAAVQSSDGEQDVQLVPVFVLWGRPVEKEERWYKAMFSDNWNITGRFKKLMTIILHGRNTLVQFKPVVSIQEEMKTKAWVGLDQRLNEEIGSHLHQLRRATIGPDLSHRRTLVDELLKTVAVKRAIVTAMQQDGLSKEKAVAKARKYADEIAANYTSSAIKVFEILLSWLWNKLYDGIEVGGFERLQETAAGNGLVYVPCHRSHIDYMLLSYILYTRGLVPPHIAAGINLNLPLVGSFLRACGAFYIRRSFKDNPLYSAVFNEYLHANFVRGVSVEYFVEGGRSRTGRMMDPRPGMLQMTVRSYLRNSDMPLVFVPVYIGYEKLVESKTYIRELGGKKKKKESIFGIFRSLQGLKGSFGKVHVNFGEPIPLSDVLGEIKPTWRSEKYDVQYRPDWLPEVVDSLSATIASRINEAAAVNPVNLIAVALLSTPKGSMGEAELARQAEMYLTLLKKLPYSNSVTLPDMTGQEMVDYVEKTDMLLRYPHDMGDVLHLDSKVSVLMTYFRNNILHLLIVPSLIASCFINKRELSDETVEHLVSRIYPFLRKELTLHSTKDNLSSEIKQAISTLLEMGLLVRHWDTNELRRPTSTTLEAMQLRVLAESVRPMLERYYMGVFVLRQQASGSLTNAELEAQMVSMAKRMSMLYELNSPDYSDKALFKHFTAVLLEQGMVSADEEGKLHYSDELGAFNQDTKAILYQQIRHSIHQIVQGD